MKSKHILCLIVLLPWLSLVACAEQQPLQIASVGRIERIEPTPFKGIEPRPVDVWLPPDYPAHAPYAVLYMHDGQMLFDANITWNKQEWRVDETAAALQAEKRVRPFIVVGVWNSGQQRAADYFPQKAFEQLGKKDQDDLYAFYRDRTGSSQPVASDAYLHYLVNQLKPYIDSHYKVDPARDSTFVMGSSMGGLISWYAVTEYPHVFGGAACLSTHWPGHINQQQNNPVPEAFYRYLRQHLPVADKNRFYFDHGTKTLDESYADRQLVVDQIMKEKNYTETLWSTQVFPGAEHSEQAWAERLAIPMTFLLRK